MVWLCLFACSWQSEPVHGPVVPVADIRPCTLVVGSVTEGSPAATAGLQPGMRLEAVDGKALTAWRDLVPAVQDSTGPLTLTVSQGGERRDVQVTPTTAETPSGPARVLGVQCQPEAD